MKLPYLIISNQKISITNVLPDAVEEKMTPTSFIIVTPFGVKTIVCSSLNRAAKIAKLTTKPPCVVAWEFSDFTLDELREGLDE